MNMFYLGITVNIWSTCPFIFFQSSGAWKQRYPDTSSDSSWKTAHWVTFILFSNKLNGDKAPVLSLGRASHLAGVTWHTANDKLRNSSTCKWSPSSCGTAPYLHQHCISRGFFWTQGNMIINCNSVCTRPNMRTAMDWFPTLERDLLIHCIQIESPFQTTIRST